MAAYIAIMLGSQISVPNIMASHRVNQEHPAPETIFFFNEQNQRLIN